MDPENIKDRSSFRLTCDVCKLIEGSTYTGIPDSSGCPDVRVVVQLLCPPGLLVGWLAGSPHSIGQREGIRYVFENAIDHQNRCSFGAICKGANSILEFDTFCCCCLWWLGFSCIQLPFFLVCWKT